MKKTIQGITCYGKFKRDSNVLVAGYYPDGRELDEIWCGEVGIVNWTGAVKELKAWADRNNLEIVELSAC